MVKYKHEKKQAIRFTLNIEGDTQEYAMSLLHIINNAREFPKALLKVENTPSNSVYVTCRTWDKDLTREYLEQFGEIVEEETINWFVVSAEYDRAGWQELFGDDCYVDFDIDIE